MVLVLLYISMCDFVICNHLKRNREQVTPSLIVFPMSCDWFCSLALLLLIVP